MTESYTLAKGIVCTCGHSCGHGPGIGLKMSQVDTEGWNVTLLCVRGVRVCVCLCVCLVGGQHGLGLALSHSSFSLTHPRPPQRCETIETKRRKRRRRPSAQRATR